MEYFTEFEQGQLLNKIIEYFIKDIEDLGYVRGMIDYKFEIVTCKFFKWQAFVYAFGYVLPLI